MYHLSREWMDYHTITLSHYRIISLDYEIQPVPEKIRHEMVIEIQIRVLNNHHRSLFDRRI